MPPRSRGAPRGASREAGAALLLLGVFASACGLTSLDEYFVCAPEHRDCQNPASNAGGGASGDPASGGVGAAPTAGGGGSAGDTPVVDGGMGGSAADSGSGADAGSARMRGSVAPGDACALDAECAHGTCFRGVCGDPLELSYMDTPDKGSTDMVAKWIKFQFQITNRTAVSYPLSALKVRYYYSPEDVVSEFQVLTTSAPPNSDSDVLNVFGTTKTTPSWTYLEVAFNSAAGTLAAGHTSGIVKVGVHDKGFGSGTFFQRDDYSYGNVAHITLYRDSELVSGVEPK